MSTITDSYGRTINVTINSGGLDIYTYDGIAVSFATGFPQAQALTTLEGMANSAPVVTTITFLQFLALFTQPEQEQIISSPDPNVRIFMLSMASGGNVNLSNPNVETGINYLVLVGVLTSLRATAILGNQAP